MVLNRFNFCLSLKLFISPLGLRDSLPGREFSVVSFCHLSLGLYHDTPFWPTKLLLKIQLIPLWRFLCILLTAFLMKLLKFSLPFISVILIKNFFFFFGCTGHLLGSQFPDQRLNPRPQQWKPRILTTRPPENSLCNFNYDVSFCGLLWILLFGILCASWTLMSFSFPLLGKFSVIIYQISHLPFSLLF